MNSFNIINYLEEAEVSYSESGKNISRNWIGINCPFCDDNSNHCGINTESNVFSCFRCGSKGRLPKLIMAIENKSYNQILPILKQFSLHERKSNGQSERNTISSTQLLGFIQKETVPLTNRDKEYLSDRKFNADNLEKTYHLRSCKPTSIYKHRILIPFYVRGTIQTFTTRDVSGLSNVKYLHCPVEQSIKAPKDILYNVDNCKDSCLCLEGCFDTFRIGRGSVSLSGIQYTANQLLVLSKFKQVFLLFDPEEKAQEMALQLGKDLSFCSSSIDIIQIKIDCDPGDMKDEDVKHLKKELFGRNI